MRDGDRLHRLRPALGSAAAACCAAASAAVPPAGAATFSSAAAALATMVDQRDSIDGSGGAECDGRNVCHLC